MRWRIEHGDKFSLGVGTGSRNIGLGAGVGVCRACTRRDAVPTSLVPDVADGLSGDSVSVGKDNAKSARWSPAATCEPRRSFGEDCKDRFLSEVASDGHIDRRNVCRTKTFVQVKRVQMIDV
eukprot:2365109-Rhodomonas_salina.1